MDKFYSDSNTDIYCGDCLEIMPHLSKVDMILCDLPYGTTACKWDAIIPFEALWQSYKIVAKDNSAIACKNTNRKCIGIELSEDYCAMSAARCVAANMGIVR